MRAKEDAGALTERRFAGLLARLHVDPAEAGQEYERLRRALIRFFDWRGAWPSDVCADDCLDRLARRLDEQTPVQDVRHFALGIARLVLLERQRQPMTTSLDHAPQTMNVAAVAAEGPNPLDQCFDRCLAAMPSDSRTLLLSYYEAERDRKIANRRRLATEMGLSENALRSRIQRLRNGLEARIQECLSRRSQDQS